MKLGYAYRRAIPRSHAEALFTAAEIMGDHIAEELGAIRSGTWTASDSALADDLPPRYLPRYTPQFMRRFCWCALTVIWKLGQRKRLSLSCVAEELAAHLLIQQAGAVLEQDGHAADFGLLEEYLFEDLDFEFLYDNSSDGIERSAVAETIGMENLPFADWFERFGAPDNHAYAEPHPLVYEPQEANREASSSPSDAAGAEDEWGAGFDESDDELDDELEEDVVENQAEDADVDAER